MSHVPPVPRITVPLPHPALPGLTGDLWCDDVRNMEASAGDAVRAFVMEAWSGQVGDPAEQPDADPDAVASGVYLNGELCGWGALYGVKVTEQPDGTLLTEGSVIGAGLPGNPPALLAVVVSAIDGFEYESDGLAVRLGVVA